jgi:L-iditol 2-dehydrogenase
MPSFADAFAPLLASSTSTTSTSSPARSLAPPQLQTQQDKAILVFGVGTIGLLAAALSRFLGARKICAVDIDPTRLEFAKANGWADDTFVLERPAPGTPPPATPAEALQRAKDSIQPALKQFGEEGFDVVFECTGVEKCVQMGVFASAPGSKLLLIGMGSPSLTLPVSAAATREVDIVSSLCISYIAGIGFLTSLFL